MNCSSSLGKRCSIKYCKYLIAFILLYHQLFQFCNGSHLSKTISLTALDLARSAGLEEDDISAAVLGGNGSGSDEEGEGEVDVDQPTSGLTQQIQIENTKPSIIETLKTSRGPILPLCCSMETEDVEYYECGGSVATSNEDVKVDSFQRKTWKAPYKLVSTKSSMEFRLEKTVLSCQSATFSASISLDLNVTEGGYFYPDGNLKFENEFYRINEYCISTIRKDKLSLQICQANCSNPLTPCIQKCCGLDEIYSFGSDDYPTGCQPMDDRHRRSISPTMPSVLKWSPTLYHNLSTQLALEESSHLTPHYIYRYPSNFKHKCKTKKTTVFPFGMEVAEYLTMVTGKTFKSLQFRLRKDGWLLYPFVDSKGNEIPVINRIQNYCVDGAQNYGEVDTFSNMETQTVLFLCSGGVDEAFENSIIVPESEEINTSAIKNDNPAISGHRATSTNPPSFATLSNGANSSLPRFNSSQPSSAEIYSKSKQRPHVLYQLFQFNSHSIPANVVMNHNTKKLTKIKERRPTIISLFPTHPNRTKFVTKKVIKKPKFQLPSCCAFSNDVNDEATHHCNNRMVVLKMGRQSRNSSRIPKPIWKVPEYFMVNRQETPFALDNKPLTCQHGLWQLQGFIHNFQKNVSNSNQNSGLIQSGILSDGYLKYENEFYSPDEFCVNGLSPLIMEVLICKPNCKSKTTPCIPKCCGMDEAYSLGLESGHRGCAPLSDGDPKFRPTFYRNMHTPLKAESQEKIYPHFIQRYPPRFKKFCYQKITLAFPFSEAVADRLNPTEPSESGPTFKNLQFRFKSDGRLMYNVPDEDGTSLTAIYDRKEYCVDLITDYGMEEPMTNHENQTILFICASQPNTQDDENFR